MPPPYTICRNCTRLPCATSWECLNARNETTLSLLCTSRVLQRRNNSLLTHFQYLQTTDLQGRKLKYNCIKRRLSTQCYKCIIERYLLDPFTSASKHQCLRALTLHRTNSSSPPSDSFRGRGGPHALGKIRLISSLGTCRKPSTHIGRALSGDEPGSRAKRAVVIRHGIRNANILRVHLVERWRLHVTRSLANNTREVVLVILEVSGLKEHDGDECGLFSDLGDLVLGEGV
jgi:hypothetical protein